MAELSRSIYRCFSETAKARSSERAVFFKTGESWLSLSFGELYSSSISLGNFLSSCGIRPADKVAIILGNQPEWPISFMAIQYLGCVAVPVDMNLSPEDIKKQIDFSEAKVVLSTEKMRIDLSGVLPNIKVILVDSQEFRNKLSAIPSIEDDKILKAAEVISDDALSAIFFTSGTTDTPKAIMLTQKNLLSNLRSFTEMKIIKPGYVFISFLPLHHTYSFMVTCLVPLLKGGHISYPLNLSSEEIIDCMKATKVNVLVGVPRFFNIIHRNIKNQLNKMPFAARLIIGASQNICWFIRRHFNINLNERLFSKLHQRVGGSLNYMISGGARLEPDVAYDLFRWGFTVLEGYGLTETSPVVAFNTPLDFRIESVGKVLPGVDVRIVDPDDQGVGEIAIRGENVMSGYYKQREETDRVVRDGWFFSGDLGYLDKEGYLYVKGRKDEMLVLESGKKVNPEEIEKHYGSSPYIKEICVTACGGGADGLRAGLKAVVVLDEKYVIRQGDANVEEKVRWVFDALSSKLSPYKRIHGFVLRKSPLPRTAIGKLMRHKISVERPEAQVFSQERDAEISDEDLQLLSSGACQKTLKFISSHVKKRSVNLSDHLEMDLGLDSLGRIELLMELGQFLNIQLSDSEAMDLFRVNTVKDLIIKARPFLPKEMLDTARGDFSWAKALAKPPAGEMLELIRLKPSFIDKAVTLSFILTVKALFRVFCLLRIKGKENLPEKGPFIIYANHSSYLDALVIASSIPLKLSYTAFYVGFRNIFFHPLIKGLIKVARLIPIDVNLDLIGTLQACAYLLKNSKVLCYFPEGGCSPYGEVLGFKKGIAILAKEADVLMVPVYIDGTFRVWSSHSALPQRLARITVTIGKAFLPSDLSSGASDVPGYYESVSERLRAKLMELKKS